MERMDCRGIEGIVVLMEGGWVGDEGGGGGKVVMILFM